jgi:hypothetical protein
VERSANPGGEVRIQNRIESRAQRDVHSLRLTGKPEVALQSLLSTLRKQTFMQRFSICLKAPNFGLQKRIAIAFLQAIGFRNAALSYYF